MNILVLFLADRLSFPVYMKCFGRLTWALSSFQSIYTTLKRLTQNQKLNRLHVPCTCLLSVYKLSAKFDSSTSAGLLERNWKRYWIELEHALHVIDAQRSLERSTVQSVPWSFRIRFFCMFPPFLFFSLFLDEFQTFILKLNVEHVKKQLKNCSSSLPISSYSFVRDEKLFLFS